MLTPCLNYKAVWKLIKGKQWPREQEAPKAHSSCPASVSSSERGSRTHRTSQLSLEKIHRGKQFVISFLTIMKWNSAVGCPLAGAAVDRWFFRICYREMRGSDCSGRRLTCAREWFLQLGRRGPASRLPPGQHLPGMSVPALCQEDASHPMSSPRQNPVSAEWDF